MPVKRSDFTRIESNCECEESDFCRARQQELDSMSKGDIFKSFYASLEELQAYHKKFPGLVERPVRLLKLA